MSLRPDRRRGIAVGEGGRASPLPGRSRQGAGDPRGGAHASVRGASGLRPLARPGDLRPRTALRAFYGGEVAPQEPSPIVPGAGPVAGRAGTDAPTGLPGSTILGVLASNRGGAARVQ